MYTSNLALDTICVNIVLFFTFTFVTYFTKYRRWRSENLNTQNWFHRLSMLGWLHSQTTSTKIGIEASTLIADKTELPSLSTTAFNILVKPD